MHSTLPPRPSLSLSPSDTHSSSPSPFLHPPLPVLRSHSVERASRRQQAAAEERAGRRLQPPLQQIVPPVQWKLNGCVAEGMEGRAAGAGRSSIVQFLLDLLRFHLISRALLCYAFSTLFYSFFFFARGERLLHARESMRNTLFLIGFLNRFLTASGCFVNRAHFGGSSRQLSQISNAAAAFSLGGQLAEISQ